MKQRQSTHTKKTLKEKRESAKQANVWFDRRNIKEFGESKKHNKKK